MRKNYLYFENNYDENFIIIAWLRDQIKFNLKIVEKICSM